MPNVAPPVGYNGTQWGQSKSAGWMTPGATHLGGFNNPLEQGDLLEQQQDQRLGQLGASAPATDLPGWEKNSQNEFQNWADQSQTAQQDAYNQAQAQYNGAVTPAQEQLAQQQGAQSNALGSLAHSATGGARGAAAAAGQATMTGAGVQAGQANQMTQQQLADKYAGADLMTEIANQQRGIQQGEYGYQAQLGAQNAAYQQGWNGLNDQAALWADSMQSRRGAADIGYQVQGNNLYNQNAQFQNQQNMQMLGAGASAAGSYLGWGAGQYGSSNVGGGDNSGGDSPYGLGNNAENPWWNG